MTGICLLCGYCTQDLDVLDEHLGRHQQLSWRTAINRWRQWGWCPTCGAEPGKPCRSYGDHVVDPHARRYQLQHQSQQPIAH